jgi:hypothetical protein
LAHSLNILLNNDACLDLIELLESPDFKDKETPRWKSILGAYGLIAAVLLLLIVLLEIPQTIFNQRTHIQIRDFRVLANDLSKSSEYHSAKTGIFRLRPKLEKCYSKFGNNQSDELLILIEFENTGKVYKHTRSSVTQSKMKNEKLENCVISRTASIKILRNLDEYALNVIVPLQFVPNSEVEITGVPWVID